jgi:hypothetical protein
LENDKRQKFLKRAAGPKHKHPHPIDLSPLGSNWGMIDIIDRMSGAAGHILLLKAKDTLGIG